MKTFKIIMLGLVAATTTSSAQPNLKGYDKENMDLGVKPGTDFVQ